MTLTQVGRGGLALLAAAVFSITGAQIAPPAQAAQAAPAAPAVQAEPAPLANLAHLDWLLDTASPPAVDGHTTYRLAAEPNLLLPWTYADARDGGTFERVGGGDHDTATDTWGQGAFNADDVARAAVVYLRHWTQTGAASSRQHAYELLRSLAYLQTSSGPNAGNVVLWMQPDGTLNPSADPVELPDPSDSGPSYWLARTIWAFGEGYAAFAGTDPAFAGFLADRLALSRAAVDRQVLSRYGEYENADGRRVPAWLIVDGADASAEAVLGLSAYVDATGDAAARQSLQRLAEGIAAMGTADTRSWPYGAILPWAASRSMWHAWGSQMPAALATASAVLDDESLLKPAVRDGAAFTPTMLIADGPDNGWFPTPADRTQIAYGADARLQSLLAVADATGSTLFTELAGIQAAWYFGANRAGATMYDPATGVTYDGLAPDGTVNRNSGAESTIHGLLSMLALDARPQLAQRARSVSTVQSRNGLTVIEAESAASTTGKIETPASAWTEESLYSGDVLVLDRGEKATFAMGTSPIAREVEPVQWLPEGQRVQSLWTAGLLPVGLLSTTGPAQGISPASGVLLPATLQLPLLGSSSRLTVHALSGTVRLDALLVRPVISRLQLGGAGGSTELIQSAERVPLPVTVGTSATSTVRVYDAAGRMLSSRSITAPTRITVPAGGLATVMR
ncbi:hypothetical protein WDJ51_13785 [Rathayibacter sp. YIM 133350]|uniref:hypothetical protein n=1 Tax=Rathayibacter sp. YIM 133350 TaxID=3131992 RepID=UPI00307F30D9